jgi:hypothetical protein
MNILELAKRNQQKAWEIIEDTRIVRIWEAERISAVLTDEMRLAILKLKYETPDTEKIMGVEYYQAVIQDGVRSYPEFEEWRRLHPAVGVVEWMP